jgi:hypothetical protein
MREMDIQAITKSIAPKQAPVFAVGLPEKSGHDTLIL